MSGTTTETTLLSAEPAEFGTATKPTATGSSGSCQTTSPGKPTNPQHSAVQPSWKTPIEVIESARRIMGTIDTDPATSVSANKVVLAKHIYTPSNDGLAESAGWFGNVFLNPPGRQWKAFLLKLNDQMEKGHAHQCFYLGFSLEQLRNVTSSEWDFYAKEVLLAVPHKRIRFIDPDTDRPGGSPTHGNFFLMVLHPKNVAQARTILEPWCNLWSPTQ